MNPGRKKHITLIILGVFIGIIVGYMIGYGNGFAHGVSYTINMGYNFLESAGVDFSLTAEQISDLVQAYKLEFQRVGGSQRTVGELIINDG